MALQNRLLSYFTFKKIIPHIITIPVLTEPLSYLSITINTRKLIISPTPKVPSTINFQTPKIGAKNYKNKNP